MVLHVMHLGESLHGSGDLGTGHLLVEGVDKSVRARALIRGHREGVKLRIKSVRLRAEGKTSRHTKLKRKGQENHLNSHKDFVVSDRDEL